MKKILLAVLLIAAAPALSHPGHGRPGFAHFHEFSDGLVIGVGLVVAAVLAAWALKK